MELSFNRELEALDVAKWSFKNHNKILTMVKKIDYLKRNHSLTRKMNGYLMLMIKEHEGEGESWAEDEVEGKS